MGRDRLHVLSPSDQGFAAFIDWWIEEASMAGHWS